MATGKRFYWMKLKESFMTSDTIDFFMSQPNGAQYVVLYQMLCLKTINTGGKLERQIGEVIIPFDIQKITRDMKWFSEDTVRVAMQLYQQFGLIYKDDNGTLIMADHDNLVGSETDWAIQKQNQKKLPSGKSGKSAESGVENFHTDIEIRDRDKRLEKEKEQQQEVGGDDTFGLTAEEAQRIAMEHSEVIDAAVSAGFPDNKGTHDKIIALYAEFGKDILLAGISACVDQTVTKPAYLRKCCQNIANGEGKTEQDPLLPKDHVFMGW